MKKLNYKTLNCTFYFYGDFGFGYNQYPYDGAEATFRQVASLASGKQQTYIRREGETMYYGYICRLDQGAGQYFGLCLLVHGVMIRDLRVIKKMLEEVVENIVIADRILSIDERGNIIANVRQLIDYRNELSRIDQVVQQKLQSLDPQWMALPRLRFGISVDEVRSLSFDAIPFNVERCCSNNGLILLQDTDPVRVVPRVTSQVDRERMDRLEASLRQAEVKEASLTEALKRETADKNAMLNALQRETADKDAALNALQRETAEKDAALKELRQLKRRQPSTTWRIIRTLLLLLLLAAVGWWGYGEYLKLGSSLDSKKRHYENIDRTNRDLVSDLNELQEALDAKTAELQRLGERVALQDTIIDALMDQANIRQPLVSTSLYVTREAQDGYASATIGREARLHRGECMQVHFRYVGLRDGTAHVKLRLTTPDNSWWVITLPQIIEQTVPVHPGSNVYDFGLWKPDNQGSWKPGKYLVELMLDDQVVQSKEFYVN